MWMGSLESPRMAKLSTSLYAHLAGCYDTPIWRNLACSHKRYQTTQWSLKSEHPTYFLVSLAFPFFFLLSPAFSFSLLAARFNPLRMESAAACGGWTQRKSCQILSHHTDTCISADLFHTYICMHACIRMYIYIYIYMYVYIFIWGCLLLDAYVYNRYMYK